VTVAGRSRDYRHILTILTKDLMSDYAWNAASLADTVIGGTVKWPAAGFVDTEIRCLTGLES
jgi:hypothetical protein